MLEANSAKHITCWIQTHILLKSTPVPSTKNAPWSQIIYKFYETDEEGMI